MKKIGLAVIIVSLASAVSAKSHDDYQQAVNAIKMGKRFSLLVDYDKCQFESDRGIKLSGLASVKMPDSVFIRGDKLVARVVVQTGDIMGMPQLGNVFQSATLVIDKAGSVTTSLHLLDPVTYQDKISPIMVTCTLGDSAKVIL